MPLLTAVCSALRLRIWLPLSAVAATAASAAGRLAALRPVMPMALSSATVSAGVGVPPAAVSIRRSTTLASWSSSAMLSTLALSARATRLLSRVRPLALVVMPPRFTPMLR